MFADEEKIPNHQRSLNRGNGPPDLTMIRGNSLALRSFAPKETELDAIDREARISFVAEFQTRISAISKQLTTDEQQVCSGAVRSMRRSFERIGSLSL